MNEIQLTVESFATRTKLFAETTCNIQRESEREQKAEEKTKDQTLHCFGVFASKRGKSENSWQNETIIREV